MSEESERLEREYLKRTTHCCPVVRLFFNAHPTNPKYKVGSIKGHQIVVGDHYENGVLGFYVPVGAILPDPILEDMWLKGRLAGKKKNRVKLRIIDGVTSDGLFYGSVYHDDTGQVIYSRNWNPAWAEGHDVSTELGITFVDGPDVVEG